MKIIKNPLQDFEPLCRFASTDETRYHLRGVFFDPSGWCISTDSHRLFGTKQLYNASHDGQIAKIEPFAGSWDVCPYDKETKYPAWQSFIVKGKQEFAVNLQLPEWLDIFKKPSKKSVPIFFGTNFGNPVVSLTRPPGKDVFCINANLIAPLAGREICMQWKDESSPVLVTEKYGAWDKGEWFAIIMPMKGGRGLEVTMPKIHMEDLEQFGPDNVKSIKREA